MRTCPVCYNELSDEATVCDVCGTAIVSEDIKETNTENLKSAPKHSKQSSLISYELIEVLIQIVKRHFKIICASVGVLLVLVLILCLFIPSGSVNYFVYVKDDQVYMSKVSNISPKQATSDFGKGSFDSGLGQYCRLSDNGKKFFFFDGGTNNLYTRSSGLNDEPTFIASNISIYDINNSGNLLTYIKDGNKLFQHNLNKQLDMIDSGVVAFMSSSDGKTLLYTKLENDAQNLYSYKFGKEPELLVPMFDNLYYVSDDFDKIYFTKKGYFFKQKVGDRPETIASNVQNVIRVYESGEAYFIVKDQESYADNLYYYDGKKAKMVFGGISSFDASSAENPAITFTSAENGVTTYHIAVKSSAFELDPDTFGSVFIDSSGENIYYISNGSTQSHTGDLYTASISKKGIGNAELIDSDVFDFRFFDNREYLYIKNYNPVNSCGEVFANGKKVGDNISWTNVTYIEEKDCYIFFTNIDNEFGDMLYFDNGKVKDVATDVLLTNYQVTPGGEVLYLTQYSQVYKVGELFLFNGSKSKNIDLLVSQIAKVYVEDEFDEFLKNTMVLH